MKTAAAKEKESRTKDGGNRIRVSLRYKVFLLIAAFVMTVILTFTALEMWQFRRFSGLIEEADEAQDRVIRTTMSNTLEDMTTDSIRQYVRADAQIIDGIFQHTAHDMQVLAKQAEDVLENPGKYNGVEIPPPAAENEGKLTMQLLFSHEADPTDAELMEKVANLGVLQNTMTEIIEGGELVNDCLIALEGGASVFVDSSPMKKLDKHGQPLNYEARRRPFYPAAVLKQGTVFTPTNFDFYRNSLQVLVGVPVYANGKLEGVCCGSIDVGQIHKVIDELWSGEDTYLSLVNETGNVIYSQRDGGELALDPEMRGSLLGGENTELVQTINSALEGNSGMREVTVDGEQTYIVYEPLQSVGWALFLSISKETLERPTESVVTALNRLSDGERDTIHEIAHQIQTTVVLLAVILFLLAAVASLSFSRRLFRALGKLRDAGLSFINREEIDVESSPKYFSELDLRTGDEIEDLWGTMRDLEENVVSSMHQLKSVTAEKERIDTELGVARKIQADMLPKAFPAFPERKEFDLYASMVPAKEVAGDFYDFFLIDDDHLALVMADVSGKGVPAALFMVIARTIIKNVAVSQTFMSPGEILSDVNEKLCEGNEESMFVTVWLGILTISTGHLVSANAGHEYPAICRRGGNYELIKDVHGPGLGLFEGVEYKNWEGDLRRGDLLFLYTDGVPEATNEASELFGNDRMLAALDLGKKQETLQEMLDMVRLKIDLFAGNAPQFDDITMMVIRYKE